jgi:hypothetical protein
VGIERVALSAGDYAVTHEEVMAAAVERKTFENFTASLSDGTLAFQMQRLEEDRLRRRRCRSALGGKKKGEPELAAKTSGRGGTCVSERERRAAWAPRSMLQSDAFR